MPEEEFVEVFPKILEYCVPKLQRTDLNTADDTVTEIKITHVVQDKGELESELKEE